LEPSLNAKQPLWKAETKLESRFLQEVL